MLPVCWDLWLARGTFMDDAQIRSAIDISQIKKQEIPDGAFPTGYPCSDFRVYFDPEAHKRIIKHATTDTRIELCGILVGRLLKDQFGPFALIDDIIVGEHAQNEGAQVTFTQQTWAHVFSELDKSHPGKRILGWYHTHPGFGIFLSPMDMFIHQNFFSQPFEIAFVIDPVAGDEGLFHWHDGKTVRAQQYWVGDGLRLDKRSNHPKPLPPAEPGPVTAAAGIAAPELARDSSTINCNLIQVCLLLMILFRLQLERAVQSLYAWLYRLLGY